MKNIIFTLFAVLLVAGLFACTQNTGAPAGDSGSEPGNSLEGQPNAEPGRSPEAPPASSAAGQPPADDIIKADDSSVLLEMPEQVRFGEAATATLVNNSDEMLTFGAGYSFQYYVNGAWVSLNYREGRQRAFIAIAYMLSPGGEMEVSFIIENDEFTIPLGPGEYRLIKSIAADNGGESTDFEVKGVFTID